VDAGNAQAYRGPPARGGVEYSLVFFASESILRRMNLCPWIPLLFLALTSTLPLYAQTPVAGQPSGIMLRVERIYDGENTCVLLNRSGDYRLERYFLHKTNVYVGLLPPQNVQEIQAVLDASPLAQLSQGDIHRDMNSHTFDKLSIDVSRASGTQSLVFFDPESREPFRESLNPILQKWIKQNIENQKFASVAESLLGGLSAPLGCQ